MRLQLVRMHNKVSEQPELDLRQMDVVAAPRYAPVGQIDLNFAEVDDGAVIIRCAQTAPQHGANPRGEFRDAERLGQIVVRASIERLHLVGFADSRR